MIVAAAVTFVGILAETSASVFSGLFLSQLIVLKVIAKLTVLLPAALYLAILLTLGRLYSDSEIVAMWAGGIGPRQINAAVFRLLLVFAVVTAVISLYLSPAAFASHGAVLARAKANAAISGILPGRFLVFSNGELVAYTESLSEDGREMKNVFAKLTSGDTQNLLVAKRARFSGDEASSGRYIVLEDGYRYSGVPGSVDYTVYRFAKHSFRIDRGGAQSVVHKSNALGTFELIRKARAFPAYAAELQWRLSQPISMVLLGMLAVPLARTLPRQGKYTKIAMGVAVFFLYGNAVGVMQTFVERNQVSPLIGIWPVHILVGALVAALLYFQAKGRFPVPWRRSKRVSQA